MTTAAIVDIHALPTRAPEQRPERERHLRALPAIAPRRAPRLVHGVVALIGLTGIVVAQLGLTVVISEGAYRLSALQGESTALARTEQTLAEDIAVLSSPQHVAVAADELGMLAGQPSQFLTLSGEATAGGPDALHMQAPAIDQFGIFVPNALLAEEPQAAATVQQVQAEAARSHPGMLLPAGEAAVAGAPAPAPAVDEPAPGTLLPTAAAE
ncbi:hypothetical protein [Agrococcus sp. DT81.2]|uniref:hypothetical protein n=1 Tax=Agrococcus sp. DT81.2 TaxID=3393414 RepID=UPI003CE55B92